MGLAHVRPVERVYYAGELLIEGVGERLQLRRRAGVGARGAAFQVLLFLVQ